MAVSSLDAFRYRVPFAAPVNLGRSSATQREGLLVRLSAESGRFGWGEIAPLPGFSAETLDEACAQFLAVRASLGDCPAGTLEAFLLRASLYASVRFGLELALLDLRAQRRRVFPPSLLAASPRTEMTLGALLGAAGEDVEIRAARLREAGCRSMKLKIGRGDPPVEAETVRRLRQVSGPSVEIRLDANRAWAMPDASAFLRAVSDCGIAYVEEPLADPAGLEDLAGSVDVPIALDETLVGLSPGDLARHRYARAVILKPTLIGGIQRTLDMAAAARALSMKPVVSSAFETGVGLLGLLALGAAVSDEDVAVGLDTYRHLARDVLRPRLELGFPKVRLPELFAAKRRVIIGEPVHP